MRCLPFMAAVGLTVGVAVWLATAATESCSERFSNPIADVVRQCLLPFLFVPGSNGNASIKLDERAKART